MNLRIDPFLGGALSSLAAIALGVACSAAQSPDPKPAIDFGQQYAVELCKLGAPAGNYSPDLCEWGSEFLRPFVEQAARQFAQATLQDSRMVAASAPCPPFADGPAPVPPGTAAGGAGQ